ncbi:carbohydrate-binding protein [Chachezhania sediminis]|uniref:carbohydrate-binding protein n=1 Tax=Chachezhania sediminis TaxID=2599291 RepID=UPI00131C0DF2|nr:carbohydrate-binding protein [Chachezhania sediminis]
MPQTAPEWFTTPATPFRPATYWFWHHLPGRAEIEAGLASIRDAGFGTVLVQARMAYPQADYLNADWCTAWAHAARTAKAMGLTVGIYDEYNWMSGMAAGRTVEGRDDLRERHLFWVTVPAGAGTARLGDIRSDFIGGLGEAGMKWVYDGGRPEWGDWQIAAAVTDAGRDLTDRATLAGTSATHAKVAVQADAPVHVFVAARSSTSRMINYLLPEAADRFTQVAYAPHRDALGAEEFAETVAYMFFDHPYNGFYVWDGLTGPVGASLLWDESFGAALAEAAGLSLAQALLPLVQDAPGMDVQRGALFRLYQDRANDVFFGTLRRWCDAAGVGLAGHELLAHVGGWGLHDGFGRVETRVAPGMDYFAVDKFRTDTTVDASNFEPQLTARMGDSVARAAGRSRCIVEQYATGRGRGASSAAGQWGLTLETLRAQALRHTLAGARQFLMHAVWQTDGWDNDPSAFSNPRFDFAPGINFEPWYPLHAGFAAELSRVSAFLEGEPQHAVALVYPLEHLRRHGGAGAASTLFGERARTLTEAGIGFDIVDAARLAQGRVMDGAVDIGIDRYSRLLTATDDALPHGLPTGTVVGPSDDPDLQALRELYPGPTVVAVDGLPLWQRAVKVGADWHLAVFNDALDPRTASLTPPKGAGVWSLTRFDARDATLEPADAGPGETALTLAANQILCLRLSPDGMAAGTLRLDAPMPQIDPGRAIVLQDGWTLELDGGAPAPIAVDRGWERQGRPVEPGTGIYRLILMLDDAPAGPWQLALPGVATTSAPTVNGQALGERGWSPHIHDIPEGVLNAGPNLIEITVRATAANRYYAGTPFQDAPEPCGLTQPPRIGPVQGTR